MDTRFGCKGTECDGIFFTEQDIPNANVLKRICVEISRQNSNLVEVKREMSLQAQAVGANVIINFRYGQKAHKKWELLLPKWDTESWHGEGDAIKA